VPLGQPAQHHHPGSLQLGSAGVVMNTLLGSSGPEKRDTR